MDDPSGGVSPRLPYQPGLDGFRGVAVIAVVLYHSGFRWARGGFLGVTAFFVLSGFLITGLLLRERDTNGAIALGRFWGRRARRLAPAVLVVTGLIVALVAGGMLRAAPSLVGDAVAALAWVGNWRQIVGHRGYGGAFGGTSPFQHLWSLGVEEQFYLALPPVVVLATARRGRSGRALLATVAAAAVLASSAVAAALHHPGGPIGRAYYGTDARAAEPFIGVLLAVALVGPAGLRRFRRSIAVDAIGIVCLVGLGALVVDLSERSDRLYRGGFLLAAVLSAGVVVAAIQPGGLLARALGVAPLAGLGRISYGVYLFHWPVFLWLTERRTRLTPWELLGARSAVTVAVAATSYLLVERPIRAGRLPRPIALVAWMDVSVATIAGVVAVTASAAAPNAFALSAKAPTAAGTAGPAATSLPVRASSPPTSRASGAPHVPGPPAAISQRQVRPAGAARSTAATAQLESPGPDPNQAPPIPPSPSPNALRVVVVGDSLANNLGTGLQDWAANRTDVVVYNLAIPACPISRGGARQLSDGSDFPVNGACGWWADAASARAEAFARFNPQVVVIQDGANELPDRKIPGWSSYRHTGQAQFDAWLLGEYRAAISTFTAGGARALALNAACADWETIGGGWAGYALNSDGDHRVASLDRTTSALAGYGATTGDLFGHLCPNGSFSDTVDGVSNARPDGYHLSRAAARAVATKWLGPLVLGTAQPPAPTPVVTAPTPG